MSKLTTPPFLRLFRLSETVDRELRKVNKLIYKHPERVVKLTKIYDVLANRKEKIKRLKSKL